MNIEPKSGLLVWRHAKQAKEGDNRVFIYDTNHRMGSAISILVERVQGTNKARLGILADPTEYNIVRGELVQDKFPEIYQMLVIGGQLTPRMAEQLKSIKVKR